MNFLCKDTESWKAEEYLGIWPRQGLAKTSARACAQRCTNLLHLGSEVSVTVGNNELNGFIGDFFIRAFHGYAPDKIHSRQIQTFHTLKNKIVLQTMCVFIVATRTKKRTTGLTSWVPWRLSRWSHKLTFSKKVLNRLKPTKVKHVNCWITTN